MAKHLKLEDILLQLRSDSDAQKVTVGELVSTFEQREFGPLLIVPALLTLLPTGAIPGVPAVCGLLIILFALPVLIGARQPWLPQRLKEVSIRRDKLHRAVDKAIPYARKVDRLIKPRWSFLTGSGALRLMAALSILLALAMITLGFIPFAVALPSAALVMIGLALSSDDGLVMALGLALALIAGWLVLQGV